jgi:hypothetical protein
MAAKRVHWAHFYFFGTYFVWQNGVEGLTTYNPLAHLGRLFRSWSNIFRLAPAATDMQSASSCEVRGPRYARLKLATG